MFVVIKTGGKQYRVQKGDVLEVEKLDVKDGKEVTFNEVLLVEDNGKTLVGTPLVEKAQVLAVVVESFKGEKVVVFKKKRRKQYKKKRGHRQDLTRVKIEEIVFGDKVPAKKKSAAKAEPQKEKKVEPKPKPEVKRVAEKAVEKDKPAKPAEKKAETKKPAAKKPAAKAAPAKPKAEKKAKAKPKPKVKKETATKE
jgi:large subunit ribosomal protein L21